MLERIRVPKIVQETTNGTVVAATQAVNAYDLVIESTAE